VIARPEDWYTQPTITLVALFVRYLRWYLYAFVFGYFYTAIRGSAPLTKAGIMIILIAPLELLEMLAGLRFDDLTELAQVDVGNLWYGLALKLGQVVVFFSVLGFAWERRLAVVAGFTWGRLRNLRRVQSAAAPAGTILVAVLTALGTSLASAAVAAMLSSPPSAPPPSPSPSTGR
jgi:hypothetical protein